MSKHIINKDDIKGFTKEIEIASSFGKSESKSLKTHVNFDNKKIEFIVINHGETVLIEQDLDLAVDSYNNI